jgi:DNA polymerase-3 subunit delta
MAAPAPAYLVKGDDAVLVGDVVRRLVDDALGGADAALAVTELDASSYEDDQGTYRIGPIVDAAQSPPMLSERRVVVGNQAAVFSTADAVGPLVDYLVDPLSTTVLVLVWEKGPRAGARVGPVPKKLTDALVKAGGQVIDSRPGSGRARTSWIDEHLSQAEVRLDASARSLLVEHLGEELSRLGIVLETLEAAFGPGARLSADEIAPYLGAGGDVAPWELTDAIDRGDPQAALGVLSRMMAAGRHPLQIIASLHGYVQRMLRLEGSGVASEAQAAEVLGMKGSTFPARKALEGTRRLGPDRLHDFIGLLAQADLDLRGAKAWPPELVIEVLVARLASRTPRSSSRRR